MQAHDHQPVSGKRLPRAARERQIVDAAVDVFSRRGYHAASMDEISAVADISKPMVYVYLGSKETLFITAVRREVNRLTGVVTSGVAVAGPRPEERLWHGLLAFFGFVGDYPAGWRVLHRQASSQGVPFVEELPMLRSRALGGVARLLNQVAHEHGQDSFLAAEVESLSAAVIGASESLADWWLDHREEPVDVLARRLMGLVWIGFANLATGDRWHPTNVG